MTYLRTTVLAFLAAAVTSCGLLVADVESELTVEEIAIVQASPELRVALAQEKFNALISDMNIYAAQPACTVTVRVACADVRVVGIMADLSEETEDLILAAQIAARTGASGTDIRLNAARQILARLSLELTRQGIGVANTGGDQ